MNRLIVVTAAAALTGAVAIEAAAQPRRGASEARQCFFARNANSFAPARGDAINVRAGVNRVYRLETVGGCPEIDYARAVGLRPRGAGSSLCPGDVAEIIVRSPLRSDRCIVRVGPRLTDREIRALPRRSQP